MERVEIENQAERESSARAAAIANLVRNAHGEVVLPDHDAYEAARRVWNGAVDKKPLLIFYCSDAEDVIGAIQFARLEKLAIAVRSGGHSVAGMSLCDSGIVIDLSRMKRIEVDRERRIARAEAGLSLGEFDAATLACGLATTMGVNSDTGIAGLTLGGGIGKLGRKYGLTCDNLLAADIVTADGRLLRASASENADLFWGIRGGGGNFGVVTAFEYQLHPLGAELLAGPIAFDYAHARDAMRFYAAFSTSAPDEVSLDAALITTPSGERRFAVSVCYVGAFEDGEPVIEPLTRLRSVVEDRIVPRSYLQIQSANDSVFPRGRRYYWKAQFLRELTDAAIDMLLETYRSAPGGSFIVLQHVGGAISRVPNTATAYFNRDALYDCFPVMIWDDPADDAINIRWARRFWSAMQPFSTGGVYANNLGEEGEDRVQAAYGENYSRLSELKNKYDPGNIFNSNQNIRPR